MIPDVPLLQRWEVLVIRIDQAAKAGAAQTSVGSPGQKSDFAIEMRRYPNGLLRTGNGRFCALALNQRGRQLRSLLLGEAAGQLADVSQSVFSQCRNQQTRKTFAARCVADDYTNGRQPGFDLPPGCCPPRRQVGTVQLLGHHALVTLLDDLVEELFATTDHSVGECQRRTGPAFEQARPAPFAARKRLIQQRVALMIKAIEEDVGNRKLAAGLLDFASTG